MNEGPANDRFVLHKAHARGVTAVELWVMDPLGRTQVVAVPIDSLDEALADGIAITTEALGDAFAPGEIVLAPDPATFVILGRDDRVQRNDADATARLICDLREPDGSPSALCSRSTLKRTLGRATQLGSLFYVGATIQHHWLAGAVGMNPLDIGEGVAPLSDPRTIRRLGRETARALEALGIAWRSHYLGNDGRFCLELDWVDPLTLADAIVTHRRVVNDVALDHDATAAFEPFRCSSARSRLDLYISLTRDGGAAFQDLLDPDGLAPAGRTFIRALEGELGALEIVMRGTLQSYAIPELPIVCRGSSARGDGGATVLLHGADASANPYTLLAAALGLGNEADEAVTYAAPPSITPAESLFEALHRAQHSVRMREILGSAMIDRLGKLSGQR